MAKRVWLRNHFLWFILISVMKILTHRLKFNGLKGFRQWHEHWMLLDIFRALGLLGSSWAFVLLWASAYQVYRVHLCVYFLSYHVERDFHGLGKQFLPETFLIQIELASGQKCAGGSLVVNFNFQAAPFSTCSYNLCFSHHCSEQRM